MSTKENEKAYTKKNAKTPKKGGRKSKWAMTAKLIEVYFHDVSICRKMCPWESLCTSQTAIPGPVLGERSVDSPQADSSAGLATLLKPISIALENLRRVMRA